MKFRCPNCGSSEILKEENLEETIGIMGVRGKRLATILVFKCPYCRSNVSIGENKWKEISEEEVK